MPTIRNSIKNLLFSRAKKLQKISTTPRMDLEILISKAINKERIFLYTNPEYVLTPKEFHKFLSLEKKRITGVPIAYLTHEKEFWNLNLKVTQAVLIPRPETEHVIELALEKFPKNKKILILDLGTGSGAIALALAHERPNWQIVAVDKSSKSLKIAQENAKNLKIKNILFKKSDWCKKLSRKQKFFAIISNPPYILKDDISLKTAPLKFEPKIALDGGKDGLKAIRTIIQIAKNQLIKNGWLILEHGNNQEEKVKLLLKTNGYKNIFTHKDLAKNPRVTFAQI